MLDVKSAGAKMLNELGQSVKVMIFSKDGVHANIL